MIGKNDLRKKWSQSRKTKIGHILIFGEDKSEIKRSKISVAEKYVWQNIIIILHGSLRTKYLTEYLKGEKRQKKLGSYYVLE